MNNFFSKDKAIEKQKNTEASNLQLGVNKVKLKLLLLDISSITLEVQKFDIDIDREQDKDILSELLARKATYITSSNYNKKQEEAKTLLNEIEALELKMNGVSTIKDEVCKPCF